MKRFHIALGLVLLLVSVAPAWALEEPETASLQSSAASDGNGTAVSVTRYATIGLDVEVTNTATVTFEGRSALASSFSSMRCTNRATGSVSTTATATGNYECPVAGLGEVRARISGCSSCVVNVFARLTTAPPGLSGGSGGGGGGTGDASLAEQQSQTAILTTIDADTGTIAGAVKAEDSAHSSAHTGIPFWGVRNDNGSTIFTDTNGDYTPISTDSAGRLIIGGVIAGNGGAYIGKAEDAPHATGDAGVMALCVRRDTAASSATTDGDYNPCHTDASGNLRVADDGVGTTTDAAATAGSTGSLSAKLRLLTSQIDTLNTAISTLSGKLPSAASMAEDTATPSVSKIQTFPMVHDGTNWDFMGKAAAESTGVQIVRPHALLADRVSDRAAITDGSSTSVVAAQGSGVRFCATTIVVSNSSATNVTVDIRDGTAGSVLMTIPAAANMGGGVIPLEMPLCTSANTIFAADPSAAASTVTISAVGFKTTL